MPAPAPPLRAQLLRAASQILAAAGAEPGAPFSVVVLADGMRFRFDAAPGEMLRSAPPDLKPLERRLLAALSDRPRTAKALVRVAGGRMGSHVYAALRRLEALGLAARRVGGYVRAPA